ncbi:jg16207 [Pararge aegeria aegeria]|uniref:Jg16207 protein n=1 Tax=Pararge aegeria aegeria TaxID=348720 RepID=A0A8S4RWC5_9NEOP|nr:jg16207 [Pararge aegeria aegeria]
MMKYCAAKIERLSKTVGVRTEFDQITTVALTLQRIFGQQVLDPEWTWRKHLIHQLSNLVLFVYVFFGTLECLKTTDDSDLAAEASYTLIMIALFPIKMLLFIENRYIFRKLYITAKTTLVEVIKADATANLINAFKTAQKIVNTLFLLVLVPISIYEITTLWYYLHGIRPLLSRSTVTLMPMTTPYYELAWILHSIFLFEVSTTIILDMWFVMLIFFLSVASDSLVKVLIVPRKADNESHVDYAKRLNESLRNFYKIHVKQVE